MNTKEYRALYDTKNVKGVEVGFDSPTDEIAIKYATETRIDISKVKNFRIERVERDCNSKVVKSCMVFAI